MQVRERLGHRSVKAIPPLDEIDLSILNLFSRNARISNRAVAAELGVSEGTIRARLQRLEAAGVMRITVVTNPKSLLRFLYAYIGLEVQGKHIRAVAAALCAMPEVRFVGLMLGRCDILAIAQVGTPQELAKLLSTRISTLPGVRSYESWEGLDVIKHDHRLGHVTRTTRTR